MGSRARAGTLHAVSEGRLVIERVGSPSDDVVAAFARLIPQLSDITPPDASGLAEILAQPNASVLLARRGEGGEILGTLTLVLFKIPTGDRALIEDVVVDETARGTGVASALVRHALDLAAAAGCRSVELTSRPSRLAANALYEHLGFTRRETNVWRHPLG